MPAVCHLDFDQMSPGTSRHSFVPTSVPPAAQELLESSHPAPRSQHPLRLALGQARKGVSEAANPPPHLVFLGGCNPSSPHILEKGGGLCPPGFEGPSLSDETPAVQTPRVCAGLHKAFAFPPCLPGPPPSHPQREGFTARGIITETLASPFSPLSCVLPFYLLSSPDLCHQHFTAVPCPSFWSILN